uniref:caspase family protein n=1 Tax=Polynucleobacter sp. TaxID=2029855 RepID=UPI0040482B46
MIWTSIRRQIGNERLKAEAEQAKRKQAELEAQLLAAQKPTQPPLKIAPQGKRVALVIGNSKYKFKPLNNPVNDATDMAASLRSVGFDVIEVKDATLKQMRAATRQFADKLEVSDVGLVYYSGHGIEVKGKNYLIPVNADIRREYEVVDQAFDASNLLRMMEGLQSGTKKRVNILIVDACRNNDLPKSWRSTNNGLARMDAPAGSFISFATAPGQVASDGQGRNSPYTKHLLQALKQPGMPIEQVFKQVRRNVMAETAGEQVPWENSSLVGDFYFTVAR